MPLPLIAAAAAAGIARAGIGLFQGRSDTRRNRNLINDAYVDSSRRLGVNQANVRQGTDEGLAARGLLQPGAAVRPTIAGTYGQLGGGADGRNPTTAASIQAGPTASSLGQQTQANTEQQLGFERKDLDFQHDKANSENDANSRANTIAAISGGINTAASVYGAGQMMGGSGSVAWNGTGNPADANLGGAQGTSRISSAYGLPSSHAFGVDAVDPLGHPQSAWASRGTMSGDSSASNADFHVG